RRDQHGDRDRQRSEGPADPLHGSTISSMRSTWTRFGLGSTVMQLSISTSIAYLLAHDPEAQVRRVPALLAQEGPAHGEAEEPRHLQDAGGGEAPRAGGPVLQAALKAG